MPTPNVSLSLCVRDRLCRSLSLLPPSALASPHLLFACFPSCISRLWFRFLCANHVYLLSPGDFHAARQYLRWSYTSTTSNLVKAMLSRIGFKHTNKVLDTCVVHSIGHTCGHTRVQCFCSAEQRIDFAVTPPTTSSGVYSWQLSVVTPFYFLGGFSQEVHAP